MSSPKPLVLIVTGSGSGFGLMTAQALAQAGHIVIQETFKSALKEVCLPLRTLCPSYITKVHNSSSGPIFPPAADKAYFVCPDTSLTRERLALIAPCL